MAERVTALLEEAPGAKTSDLAERVGLGQLQIRNVLMQLERDGMVYRTGQTRGTRWYLGDRASAPSNGAEEALPPEAGEDTPRRGPKERVLDEHRELLGQLPDADVAERTGVSVRTIASYRKKTNIAGYSGPRRRGGAGAEGGPRGAGASRGPSGAGSAWRVDIKVRAESVVRYVFAPSLVEAARTATNGASSLGGEVVGIGWVGETL
jgi:hypothetical protein